MPFVKEAFGLSRGDDYINTKTKYNALLRECINSIIRIDQF